MRICLIGDCGGHIGSIFDGTGKDIKYVGASVSSTAENMDNIKRHAKSKGHDIPYFDDWRKMLTDLKPDAVAVDTVFSNHAQVSVFALEHNINVYTEKPVATELADLDKIRTAQTASNAKLFAMLTARFDPWFYTAKRLIGSGAVGKILMVNGQKSYKLGTRSDFFKQRETYGGTIPWVAIHMIDQVLWITGEKCKSVYAKHSFVCNRDNGELEMTSIICMELQNDILISVNADYLRPANAPSHGDDRIRVAGTDGVLEVRGDRVYLINSENNGTEPIELERPEPIFDGFVNVVNGSDNPLYKDCDGIHSTLVSLKARESADNGKIISI